MKDEPKPFATAPLGAHVSNCRFEQRIVVNGALTDTIQAQARANCALSEALSIAVQRATTPPVGPLLQIGGSIDQVASEEPEEAPKKKGARR